MEQLLYLGHSLW